MKLLDAYKMELKKSYEKDPSKYRKSLEETYAVMEEAIKRDANNVHISESLARACKVVGINPNPKSINKK